MAKTYRPSVPEQDPVLPPSLRDWLPEGHLAFFVNDLVEQLDLSAILREYEDEERGYPPYHPGMLTKVLVYGYCVGVFASRKIQRRLVENAAFRVLAAGNQPDFRTIADFRKRRLAALHGFFEQVLRLAGELGAPQMGRVAIDGSKIQANASKHKAMSYGRMRDKARQLRDEVRALLAKAEAADAADDAEYGADQRGDELPAELQRRESRLARIREARAGIDAYISTRKQKHGERPGSCPRGPLPTTATRVDRMTRKLLTKVCAAGYARRRTIVEPVLGQIKQGRGFRQFLLRGFAKVQGEWALVCTTHNILKLYRLCS